MMFDDDDNTQKRGRRRKGKVEVKHLVLDMTINKIEIRHCAQQ